MLQSILADYPWLPKQASTVAGGIDNLYNVILWICVFFFLLVTILLVWFVIKYRHRPGVKHDASVGHSMTLEITWTVIPSIIVVFLYYYGFKQYMNLTIEPPNAYPITATGRMWQWSFTYPNGHEDPELHCVVNKPVRCVLESNDVIHSLYMPAFRVKKDVVPGRYNRLWFEPTIPGTYEIYCAAYCGTNHSTMHSQVIVHPNQLDFDNWLLKASDDSAMPPEKRGEKLYAQKGCAQCHSIDGTKVVGPSWKDLFGSTQQFTDGSSAVVDEQFIHNFLPAPTSKVPVGYQPIMPPFPPDQLKPKDVDALIAFMKTISKSAPKTPGVVKAPAGTPAARPVDAAPADQKK